MKGAISTCYIDFVVVASFIATPCFLLIFLLTLPEAFYLLHYILGLKYYINKYLNIL